MRIFFSEFFFQEKIVRSYRENSEMSKNTTLTLFSDFEDISGTDMVHLSNRDYLSEQTQNLPKVIT